jgi:hypothetical protein
MEWVITVYSQLVMTSIFIVGAARAALQPELEAEAKLFLLESTIATSRGL